MNDGGAAAMGSPDRNINMSCFRSYSDIKLSQVLSNRVGNYDMLKKSDEKLIAPYFS